MHSLNTSNYWTVFSASFDVLLDQNADPVLMSLQGHNHCCEVEGQGMVWEVFTHHRGRSGKKLANQQPYFQMMVSENLGNAPPLCVVVESVMGGGSVLGYNF